MPNVPRTHEAARLDVDSQIPASVIPTPARTSTSRTSFATRYPSRTATIGMTNAMYETEVAS